MASRHQRRKAAKAANHQRTERIATAARSHQIAAIVKANLSAPIERSYYPRVSCIGDMATQSHRAYICRAGGGMERRRALALKAQGKW